MGYADAHQFYLSGYNGVTEKIQRTINDVANSFCYIGFLLYEVKEFEYYKEKNYKNVVEYAEKELGFKKSTTYNFISVCENFSQKIYGRPSMQLDSKFKVFSFQKLVQMSSIKSLDVLEQITPEHTVKEIKEIKKNSTRVENKKIQVQENFAGQLKVDDNSNIVEVNFEQVSPGSIESVPLLDDLEYKKIFDLLDDRYKLIDNFIVNENWVAPYQTLISERDLLEKLLEKIKLFKS